MAISQLEQEFIYYTKKIKGYHEAIGLMFWDLRTGAPKKGVDQRGEVIGMLSTDAFEMSVSEQMASYLQQLANENLSPIGKSLYEHCQKEYDKNKKIPADMYKEYVILQSKAESVWEDAKTRNDFSLLAPYLEKLVDYNKKFIDYWGYEGHPYNALLDLYEPGITVDLLDLVFAQLREAIVPLVKAIGASTNQPETAFLYKQFPKDKQKEFSLEILKSLGYDFDAGRLDETMHPFATGLNPGDVRVTTKYDEKDWRVAVFGTIHECGHALYEQNISQDLTGTLVCDGTSMGIHESQSLFYENFVGRNYGFWKKHYELLKHYAPGQFDEVALDDFYKAINESKPSLIRIEADELTYPLHVMIRYEIEKGLFQGDIAVSDLPKVWNEKYEEYLGVKPATDAEGVLQDVHWSGGLFGYFPSYALGYMYASQLKSAMLKDIEDFDARLENGDLLPIKEWLTENIHQYGATKKPLELLQNATGEGLNVQYLIDYLKQKYTEIYRLT